ncbi:MerR family transcriptional regulator [Streptomyces sp. MK37H]|uniref:MerR family transcriptional regulator n=1 Tax=Streptomyces sp. MK37H TaxID=2699117 RepID=UPI001FFB4817|nr:MerR family transcriptional regulator [Streptomyces sp. MK37H]MBP8536566.1 MerR family transcriptional regulator [Streptomyces sp. MK37H]
MKSSGAMAAMAIGEVAQRFGPAPHVLRHWETVDLLRPARDTAGHRRYGEAGLVRVAVTLRAKEAGLGLDAIRALTAATEPSARRDILRREAETLRSRIAAARDSPALVECALGCEHDDPTRCPHYRRRMAPEG